MCNLVYSYCSKGFHASSLGKVCKQNNRRIKGKGEVSFHFSTLATIFAHNLIGDTCYAGYLVYDLIVRKCFLTCCQFFYYLC